MSAKDFFWIVFALLCLSVLSGWISKHNPHTKKLAWRVLDGVTRLPLFESESGWQEREPAAPIEPPPVSASESVSLPPPVSKPRKRLTQLRKKMIAARDKWTCQLCKQVVNHTYEIDHITPVHQGGGNEESNLRLLCRACHGAVTAQQRLS